MTDASGNLGDVATYLVEAWQAECRRRGDGERPWPETLSMAVARALTEEHADPDRQVIELELRAITFLGAGPRELSAWRLGVLDEVLRAGGSEYGLASIAHLLGTGPGPAGTSAVPTEPEPAVAEAEGAVQEAVPTEPEPAVAEAEGAVQEAVPTEPEPAVAEAGAVEPAMAEAEPSEAVAEAEPSEAVPGSAASADAATEGSSETGEIAPGADGSIAGSIEDLASEPAIEDLASEPAIEDLASEPAIEDLASEPAAEAVAASEPAAADLASEPAIEDLASEPAIEDLASEPAAEAVAASQPPGEADAPTAPPPFWARVDATAATAALPEERSPIDQMDSVAEPDRRPETSDTPWPDELETVDLPSGVERLSGSPASSSSGPASSPSTEPGAAVEEQSPEAPPVLGSAGEVQAATTPHPAPQVSVSDRVSFEATVCRLVDAQVEFCVTFVGLDEVPGALLGVPDATDVTAAEEAASQNLLRSLARRFADRSTCFAIGRGLAAVVTEKGRPKEVDRSVRKLPSSEVSASFSWGSARFPDEANDVRELLRVALVRLANMREENLTPRILVNRIRRAVSVRS